jgi:hypothetical protein
MHLCIYYEDIIHLLFNIGHIEIFYLGRSLLNVANTDVITIGKILMCMVVKF